MSIRALNWAMQRTTGSSSAKLLLMVLADHADEEGQAWPSQKRLMEICEMSEDTVRRNLKTLEDAGLLSRTRRMRPDGSRSSDLYILKVTERTPQNEGVSPQKQEGVPAKSGGHEPPYNHKDTKVSMSSSDKPNTDRDVTEVFEYWREETGHSKAQLLKGRKQKIKARLKRYSVDDLKSVIRAAVADPFHSGDNDRQTPFWWPETIFKNDQKVEQMLALTVKKKNGASAPSRLPAFLVED